MIEQKIAEIRQQTEAKEAEQREQLRDLLRQEEEERREFIEEAARLREVEVPPVPAGAAETPAEEEEQEEQEEEEAQQQQQEQEQLQQQEQSIKRRKIRFLVASTQTPIKRTPEASAGPKLPKNYVVLLEEGDQNDYISDWGRCCVAGTGSSNSTLLMTRQKCFLDMTTVQKLSLTILEGNHLHPVQSHKKSLVKIEVLVYA